MFAPRTFARPLDFDRPGSADGPSSADRRSSADWGGSVFCWADAGWHRLSQVCLGLQVLLFGTSLVLYRATDIEVRWSSDFGLLIPMGALVGAWIALVTIPGDSIPRRRMAEGMAAAVLFLSLGGWETITVGIFSFYIAGSANEAAALGVILIVVATLSLVLINRIAGARMGGMFG